MTPDEIIIAQGFKSARKAQVLVVMGSQSDMPIMQETCLMLAKFEVHYDVRIWSAHRTPERMRKGAQEAAAAGIKCIIAGAGGAAHLPGMIKAYSRLPIFGVPIPLEYLKGMDSLLSIVQMPKGKPVNTMAIGKPGAINAAIAATEVLALLDPAVAERMDFYRKDATADVDQYPEFVTET